MYLECAYITKSISVLGRNRRLNFHVLLVGVIIKDAIFNVFEIIDNALWSEILLLYSKLCSWKYVQLLYLVVSMRAVIGQFTGPYSAVRPAKI